MKKPEALIITGNGLNCEAETAYAFELAKAKPKLVSIWEILDGDYHINDYQMLAFIGGFADGDDLGAGTAQAARFRHRLRDDLEEFIEEEKPIIGICNGFQTIVKMGILPGFGNDYQSRLVTLMPNDSGKFEDRWVHLSVNRVSPCIWTQGIENLFLPVRHGEGKLVTDKDTLRRLYENSQVVAHYATREFGPTLKYPQNPNGSIDGIAALCNQKGTTLGLMPHPEAFLSPHNHPEWTYLRDTGKTLPKEGQGVQIFRNAVRYVKEL